MITIESLNEPDKRWNERLLESKYGTIYQTKEYSTYVKDAYNWETNFLLFINSQGDIVGQLLLTSQPKFTGNGLHNKLLDILTKRRIYRWSYGPVIFFPTYNDEIIKSLSKYLISLDSKVIGYEHPLSSGLLSKIEKPFIINKWSTFIIDLKKNKETLWNNLDKHSARKNIERSQKRGVVIKQMDSTILESYYKMLLETKKKVGGEVSFNDVESLWKNLNPIGLSGSIALYNEEPIGGILISSFNSYINEWGVARTDFDREQKLYSQDYLKWKIIEWGINNNQNYFDLSGVNPDIANAKEEGIFRYKEKWGGNFIEYYFCSI